MHKVQPYEFSFPVRLVKKILWACVALIILGDAAVQIGYYLLDHDHQWGLVRLLTSDGENNLPTWLSSTYLLLCSVLLFIIVVKKRISHDPWMLHWAGLACGFFFMAVDEAASLHEMLTWPLREMLGATGILWFTWVVPVFIILVFLSVVYVRFILQLSKDLKRRFVVAGAIYILGAIGMEMVGGHYSYSHGEANGVYAMITSIEEALEILGVMLFLAALLDYLASRELKLTIQFSG